MEESNSRTGKKELPLTPSAGPSNPDQSEETIGIRLSFREVVERLHKYMRRHTTDLRDEELYAGNTDLSEEDLTRLFEALVLSYFGNYTDPPKEVLEDMLEHMGMRFDYFEGKNAEIALGIIDEISQVARKHFPFALPDTDHNRIFSVTQAVSRLGVMDAYMHGKDHVVIIMPKSTFENLKHESHQSVSSTQLPDSRPQDSARSDASLSQQRPTEDSA
jgi:hypothetical protein